MKIDINTATATQLAEFASVHLGLSPVYAQMGKDKIRAMMAQAGYSQSTIDVDDSPAPVPAATTPAATAKADEPRKMIKILIPNQNEPGGKDPVPVGVNGSVMLIPRGRPVEVPEAYVHVLENANKVVYEKSPNGEPINPTFVPTHPFSRQSA